MKKQIVSETKQYQPSFPDELLLDDTPKVNSFNGVTSDGVARAIAGASGEVPVVTESDNGKVLKAIYDEGGPAVEWGEATVDQTYDATSTNAQSGVAVASAIAAIPSEVTTASGHFDLEGSVPVKVNYTGTPHVVPGSQTLSNPVLTALGPTGLAVNFSLEGLSTLDASESATLTIPSDSPAGANFYVFYSNSSSATGGPALTSSPALPTNPTITASAGHYTLTGTNTLPQFGAYVGIMLTLSSESDRPAMEEWASTLTINWPASVVDGYETTIPVVDQNYHSESANAQSGVAVAQAIAAIPSAPTYTAGDGIDISQNAVSVNVGTGLSINQGSTASMSLIADPSQVTSSHFGYNQLGKLTAEAVAAIKNNSAVKVTPLFDYTGVNHGGSGNVFFTMAISGYNNSKAPNLSSGRLISSTNIGSYFTLVSGSNYQISANTQVTVDFSTLDTTQSNLTWSDIEANPSNYILSIISYTSNFMSYGYAKADLGTSAPKQAASTVAVTTPSNHSLEVSNPVPSYAAEDAGKVLAVNAGATGVEWATPSGGGSSSSAFDTTFNLVNDGAVWKLSNSSSYYIDLTGGAGVYAYRVVAEITDSSNPTVIDDIYKVTVRVGSSSASETKTIYLRSDNEGYPEDPATILFNASGIIDISSAQHVRGMNVSVLIQPAKGASGTMVSTFTGGSVTLYLAKLSTLSGGWEPAT